MWWTEPGHCVLVLPQVVIRRLEAEGAAARAAAADKVRPVCKARCWQAVPPTLLHPATTTVVLRCVALCLGCRWQWSMRQRPARCRSSCSSHRRVPSAWLSAERLRQQQRRRRNDRGWNWSSSWTRPGEYGYRGGRTAGTVLRSVPVCYHARAAETCQDACVFYLTMQARAGQPAPGSGTSQGCFVGSGGSQSSSFCQCCCRAGCWPAAAASGQGAAGGAAAGGAGAAAAGPAAA